MCITGNGNICTLFSIFHDGDIVNAKQQGNHWLFEISIPYLAERIDPSFTSFSLTLEQVEQLYFTTWPDDLSAAPDVIRNPEIFFSAELEILSAKTEGNLINIACNQSLPELGYCGGMLHIECASAQVTDPTGKAYSISEFEALGTAYWNNWKQKNKL